MKKHESEIRREETETANKAPKSLRRKEVEKQLRTGNITKEQAIELRQKYMDSLEYKEGQKYVISCGGIRPLSLLPPMEEKE